MNPERRTAVELARRHVMEGRRIVDRTHLDLFEQSLRIFEDHLEQLKRDQPKEGLIKPKHEPGRPMDLANSTPSANFLAAYDAGDEQALWQAIIYCAGHRIPLWEWLANELVVPWQRRNAEVGSG